MAQGLPPCIPSHDISTGPKKHIVNSVFSSPFCLLPIRVPLTLSSPQSLQIEIISPGIAFIYTPVLTGILLGASGISTVKQKSVRLCPVLYRTFFYQRTQHFAPLPGGTLCLLFLQVRQHFINTADDNSRRRRISWLCTACVKIEIPIGNKSSGRCAIK